MYQEWAMNEPEEFTKNFARLTPRQREVLSHIMAGKSNQEIVEHDRISPGTVRKYVQNICDILQVPGEKGHSRKLALVTLVRRYKPDFLQEPQQDLETLEVDGNSYEFDPDFVGRKEAMAELHRLISEGERCIVILSPGGRGKTTLAWRYLRQHFNDENILYFPIAKNKKDIASIESLIEERLRQLGEEPGREFLVSLDRLRNKLIEQRLGILVDNLEPALDSLGQFIPEHRSYIELFKQVILEPNVQALTLVTSREPLKEGLAIHHYTLPPLSLQAWEAYFGYRGVQYKSQVLANDKSTGIHDFYDGNALAMKVLVQPIIEDYGGNLEEYWSDAKVENSIDIADPVNSLIKEQFSSISIKNTNAYKLLTRLGCLRFQDIPEISKEGLLCLAWDITRKDINVAINFLLKYFFIIKKENKYYLHPLVHSESRERLIKSEDWTQSNQAMAIFWSSSTIDDNHKNVLDFRLEAYYHYIEIEDWSGAVEVLRMPISDTSLMAEIRSLGYIKKGMDLLMPLKDHPKITQSMNAYICANVADLHFISGNIKLANSEYERAISILNVLAVNCMDENMQLLIQRDLIDDMAAFALAYINTLDFESSMLLLESAISKAVDLIAGCRTMRHGCKPETLTLRGASHFGICETYYIIEDIKGFLPYLYSLSSIIWIKQGKIGLSKIQLSNAIKNLSSLELTDRKWSRGYGFFYMSLSLSELGYFRMASCISQKLLEYSNNSGFKQGMGLAFLSLAVAQKNRKSLSICLKSYQNSINYFIEINAKCDLAEAYYQRALTYQKMGDDRAQADFAEALRLWGPDQINAPKQRARVEDSMNNPPQ